MEQKKLQIFFQKYYFILNKLKILGKVSKKFDKIMNEKNEKNVKIIDNNNEIKEKIKDFQEKKMIINSININNNLLKK